MKVRVVAYEVEEAWDGEHGGQGLRSVDCMKRRESLPRRREQNDPGWQKALDH